YSCTLSFRQNNIMCHRLRCIEYISVVAFRTGRLMTCGFCFCKH
ncbi:unnamed protein product, partial [Musa acuminata subsp. malaccensis]